ncbi:MAG: AMP-binding protein [Cellvibrionaceae bacterium]
MISIQSSLNALLNIESPQYIVGYDHAGDCTNLNGLQQKIADWQSAFSSINEQQVALYHSDTLEFCSALLALWFTGKSAVIPASSLPEFLIPLKGITSSFAGEFPLDNTITKETNATFQLGNGTLPKDETVALTIFTSGSSGQAAPITKTFAQLNAELNTLENIWGSKLKNSVVTGTVSHHHIYGLLFRLLWPLTTQRAFISKNREYWENILVDSEKFGPISVISSPAHLERLPPLHTQKEKWQTLKNNCQAIFSSGAPLSAKGASDTYKRLQQPIIEVYGSSETGGIAYKNQAESSLWQAFHGISIIEKDGILHIKSPHLDPNSWFKTSDQCELVKDNLFSLKGRTDRIVKTGGKRISLDYIEESLASHPFISRCKLLSLPENNNRIGAVIALSELGRNTLIDKGKKVLNSELGLHLRGKVDALAIPRYWRYLKTLPRNSQGKTLHTDLLALFDKELPKFPTIIDKSIDGNEAKLHISLPFHLYYFDGHFPGNPVLPGVVQTHWAVHYGKEFFGISGNFSHLEAIKFQQVITPDLPLSLKLSFNTEKNKLTFTYSREDQKLSSGRIVFTSTPDCLGDD